MSNAEEFPLGQLVSLYEGMKQPGISQDDRLEQARELCADPAELARKFDADVRAFLDYDKRQLAFHSEDPDRDKKRFAPRSKTRVVAQALTTIGNGNAVEVIDQQRLGFRFVDREIVTARSPGASFRTPDGQTRTARRLPTLDLLLANARDGTPIVAELKVGDDRDSFYALIQALAHAALLATPNQLERLQIQYPGTFADDCNGIDVYVVLVGSAEGSNWGAFGDCARTLAGGLMRSQDFIRWVRRVEQIKLTVSALATS